MDDLTVARHCAKALELEDEDPLLARSGWSGGVELRIFNPAVAFRLVGWLAERGKLDMNATRFCFWDKRGNEYEEPCTALADRCVAVARLVARVMTQEET